MESNAPTQTMPVLYAAAVIAIDDVNLNLWAGIVESQKLAEFVSVSPPFDRNANGEGVYQTVVQVDILLLLHNGGLQEYARKFLQVLAGLRQVSRPAVLLVQLSEDDSPLNSLRKFDERFLKVGVQDVRKGLEEIVSGLKSGAITPLHAFAPQLREAIVATARGTESAKVGSGAGGLGTRGVDRENLNSKVQSGRGGLGTPAANQEKTAADDEGPIGNFHFDEFKHEDFSELAWQIVEVARRLGEGRERQQASARRLVTAMVLSGLRRKGDERTGSWLVSLIPQERDAIRTRIFNRYPAAARHKGSFDAILRSDLTVSESMTEALRNLMETAKLLATEARPGAPVVVGARHLLGAAVRQDDPETTAQTTLKEFGLDVDNVRRQLIDQLSTWGLDDDQDAWRRVLEPVVVVVERRLPTYAADSAIGPDLIGITREVEAMASLVSAWSVEPPLSIGLFGEWGSGKSFFMQKMKERVKQIAIEARKSNLAQRDFGYYKNIVQVEFNAWHYVEGNLWASLVEHIFSNLRFEGTQDENLDSEENIRARLEKMLELMREKTVEADTRDKEATKLRAAADSAQESAKDADARALTAKALADQADLDSAAAMNAAVQKQANAQNTSEIRRNLLLTDVVEDVKLSPEVRAQIETGLEQLGINKERLQTVQGVRDALREATEAGHVIAESFVLLRQSGGWLLLLWLVAVPTAIVLLGLIFDGLTSLSTANWVHRLGSIVSVLFALMTGAVTSWKKLSPRLKPLLDGVQKMKTKRAELEARVEVERQNRARAAAELENDVIQKKLEAQAEQQTAADKVAVALKARQAAENLRVDADKAAKEAAEVRAAAEKLAREAEALRPERRIATFIQDRAAATDYRRHLGVPALIRRDFEKLSAMFETQRQAEEKGEDCGQENQKNDPTVVNRIILYIDDLDRCPPEKVVDVLRAIHLLLAFRLFVVVVAVDARWMKRSLKDRFSLMLSTPGSRSAEADGKARGNVAPEQDSWRATASPDDYLEKIFQVPFWIRPLGRSGSRRLVTELTRHDIDPGRSVSKAVSRVDGATGNASNGIETNAGGEHTVSENKSSTPSGGGSASQQKEATSGPQGVSGEQPDALSLKPAASEWSAIEPKPRTLMLTPEERDYMVSLSPVIGRSPRSVKRFINCYRLLKSTLDTSDLDRAERAGTFRTGMLLLGIVTGFPEAAPALLADLRDASRDQTPEAWARSAAERLQLEDRGKWADLLPVIRRLRQWEVRTVAPLVDAAALVDRFSFSPVQRPLEKLV